MIILSFNSPTSNKQKDKIDESFKVSWMGSARLHSKSKTGYIKLADSDLEATIKKLKDLKCTTIKQKTV